MRGGLERWKRGVESQGVRQAMAYAFKGTCDSHLRSVTGVEALAAYAEIDATRVARFTVRSGEIELDALDAEQLRRWVDGHDPFTDARRGRELTSPNADLILDGTINAPKSYSIAALLVPELAAEFEALQDRLRDRIITTWQRELNARRGAGGRVREALNAVEVVELRHRRSRALDPHIHRHLWLSVKVLGADSQWSNVDSRVAMKLHTLINAEGELAARTDPVWVAALARHGFTLDAEGEVAELVSAVRPLSRRSNQIEANRARLLVEWRQQHPGQEPSPDVVQRIDRQAWASSRPNKPGHVDEANWEQMIRGELAAIDPTLLHGHLPMRLTPVPVERVDRALLAARAIVDADKRSAPCGGRFSDFDLRAGATRAVAASGVVAEREDLQELINDVARRALAHTVDVLDGEENRPGHVKGYMASSTAALKVELAGRFAAMTCAGLPASPTLVESLANGLVDLTHVLGPEQVEAAGAIAGTDRLVSITGPAGSGKTTMLRVARAALARSGRSMVIVAPTKKAATVAGREIGTTASSLHQLLADHGWRWGRDDAGLEHWQRLRRGDLDTTTGRVYEGPTKFALGLGDRIVVDEAGMVDLHTANALATVAAETGAGIAMVGDELQAMPVGHAGAMASMTRRATRTVELTSVHRFRDPDYAALTLRMRQPATREHALAVAIELDQRGLVHRVTDAGHAREVMVEAYFRWATDRKRVALVTSTNEEADAINEAIQQRRIDLGQLTQHRIAIGQGEQQLLVGDVVQTRLNDQQARVENRAVWTIHRIHTEDIELVSLTDRGDIRRVTHAYAAEHMHLAYASTVHGIQGETTDASVVGPGVDASGLYVGMTRGRINNEALTIARATEDAREKIADCMLRGSIEVTLDDARTAAVAELHRAARDPHSGGTRNGEPISASAASSTMSHELVDLQRWISEAELVSARMASRGVDDDANGHGRGIGDPDPARLARSDALRTMLQDRREQFATLSAVYAHELAQHDEALIASGHARATEPRDDVQPAPPISRGGLAR